MLAPGALRVLASVATLFALALAEDFCNTATIGDFGKPKTETITFRKDIMPGQRTMQIKDRCPTWTNVAPVGLRVMACDKDTYPQVYLRQREGEVQRLGDLMNKASISVTLSCYPSTNSDEFEYV